MHLEKQRPYTGDGLVLRFQYECRPNLYLAPWLVCTHAFLSVLMGAQGDALLLLNLLDEVEEMGAEDNKDIHRRQSQKSFWVNGIKK